MGKTQSYVRRRVRKRRCAVDIFGRRAAFRAIFRLPTAEAAIMSDSPPRHNLPRLPPADPASVRTLQRVHAPSVPNVEAVAQAAVDLLGVSPDATATAGVPLGLVSGHTHYFDGFALMLSSPMSTAVAVAPSPSGRYELRTGGWIASWKMREEPVCEPDADDPGGTSRVADDFLRGLVRVAVEMLHTWPTDRPIRIAATSSAFASLSDGAIASFVVALGQILAPDVEARARLSALRKALADALYPFSIAYLTEAAEGVPAVGQRTFALHDTDPKAPARMVIEVAPDPSVAWALLVPQRPVPRPGRVRVRLRQAQAALDALRTFGIDGPADLREYTPAELNKVLARIDPSLRAPVAYLAGENHRVGRAWRAIVKGDAQQLGALLLGGLHARHAWMGARPGVEDAVAHVEDALADGMYGVGLTGHARALLLVGHPLVLPGVLDEVHAQLARVTKGGAHALLM
jgi:galactokinase